MPRDYVKELFQSVQRKRTQTSTHNRYRMITSQKKVQKPSSVAYCPCITKHFMNDKGKKREREEAKENYKYNIIVVEHFCELLANSFAETHCRNGTSNSFILKTHTISVCFCFWNFRRLCWLWFKFNTTKRHKLLHQLVSTY